MADSNPYQSPQGQSKSPAEDASGYRTAPVATTQMPPGIPYIVGNEAAERFSYYGMKAILMIFMTEYLLGANGKPDLMGESEAKSYYHAFVAANYFCSIVGALIADAWLGKYRTILLLSLVYCLGHLALAMDETRTGLMLGLFLVAMGAGGIKPCVSAHVGDQFGATNQHLIERVFGWFYLAINVGATVSMLLTPYLLRLNGQTYALFGWEGTIHGPALAFGVPGVLMLLATLVFWMGRHKFIHVPPAGLGFVREAQSPVGRRALAKIIPVFLFLIPFWALYDQNGSSWVLQANKMNLNFLGITWLPDQVQAVNAVLVLIFIPLFTYVVYPLIGRVITLTTLRKVAIGFFIITFAFLFVVFPEQAIEAGETPSIAWQFVAYVFLTAAEVMVSVTALEFSYTQAPKSMKSLVMALYLLSISAGNFFTSAVNALTGPEGLVPLSTANYFWFFIGIMLVTSVAFLFLAINYREERFIQDEAG